MCIKSAFKNTKSRYFIRLEKQKGNIRMYTKIVDRMILKSTDIYYLQNVTSIMNDAFRNIFSLHQQDVLNRKK